MKSVVRFLTGFIVIVSIADAATPVVEQSTWSETYSVRSASPHLVISNIWGGVKVLPGKSGEISVSAVEMRSAPDQERFDRSFETIRLSVDADADGVSFIVGDPDERWHRMDECHGCRLDIQFEVFVPPGTIIDVGTVMDGLVDINGVTGVVTASNVNGSIVADNIQECASIESVNGRVDVGFSQKPVRDCSIETINGDITLGIPADAGLDVTFDLFNGEVVSELMADPLDLPATVEHTTKNGHNQYRIQKRSGLRIGAGGATYSISSMNGDVLIRTHQ